MRRRVRNERSSSVTHIWMVPDLLDRFIVEMTRISKELSDLVGVPQALEGFIRHGNLRALPKLHPLRLLGEVHVLDPRVVSRRIVVLDMILELDQVGVWNFLCLNRGQDRRSIFMDSFDAEGRPRSQKRHEGETERCCLHRGKSEQKYENENTKKPRDQERDKK